MICFIKFPQKSVSFTTSKLTEIENFYTKLFYEIFAIVHCGMSKEHIAVCFYHHYGRYQGRL